NPSGQKIGIEDGKLVNTIPGARVQIDALSKSWTESPEPDYYVPDGVKYTVTLDGKDLKEEDDTSIGVVAPGYELEVDDIKLQPGETDTIVAGVDAETLSFTPS